MIDENPLQWCLSGESAEIVDEILGPILRGWLGKNDMSVVNGLLASAAILIATHCQHTGQSFQETSELCRRSFDLALKVAGERIQ